MKKLMTIMASISLLISPLSSISCNKQENSIDEIERPAPILPIQKKGFEKVKVDSINIQKITYNIDFYNQINDLLTKSGFDLSQIDYQVNKNKLPISLNDDLFRNGVYYWTITNKNNSEDEITATITIRNSLHLADLFTSLSIGTIHDRRPRTILIGLMQANLGMINMLDQIADQLIDINKYVENDDNHSIIKINDQTPNFSEQAKPKNFYGQINVTYIVVPFNYDSLKKRGISLDELYKDNKSSSSSMSLNLGVVNSQNIYSILMVFIIQNFASAVDCWWILVNDINSSNFEPKQDEDKGSVKGKDFKIDISFKPFDKSAPSNDPDVMDKVSYIMDQKDPVTFKYRYLKGTQE
ncbi:hypothetical protein SHELI_v1c01320 [Spiroplasma helicoides]|uniref:Lipoprotein n=1 Tax=Spiroplasma helicoides TaxID=216938 RepID=A0A1B3SJI7_9MOLU|nr:hypothetical protein [Spiroplasma helicoides]AOG60087.1 hypothetical protein SHELI_v1c01320 [Spiroplasma helicoides]